MPLSRELYLAILAMDSYNREYDQNINLSGNQIGEATILDRDGLDSLLVDFDDWQDSGFYAVAYDTSGVAAISDPMVVSFRGTNPNPDEDFLSSPIWLDMINGWTAGGGFLDGQAFEDFVNEFVELDLPDASTGQAFLAMDFISALIAANGITPGDITSTGHSLGGGLAGLIGNVYNEEAVIFDHMPYENVSEAILDLGFIEASDRWFDGDPPFFTSSADIDALAVDGEVLSYLRDLFGSQYAVIPSQSGYRFPVTLHSQAMLASLIFAEDNGFVEWHSVGDETWDAFFDGGHRGDDPGHRQLHRPVGRRSRHDAVGDRLLGAGKRRTAVRQCRHLGDVQRHGGARYGHFERTGRVLRRVRGMGSVPLA